MECDEGREGGWVGWGKTVLDKSMYFDGIWWCFYSKISIRIMKQVLNKSIQKKLLLGYTIDHFFSLKADCQVWTRSSCLSFFFLKKFYLFYIFGVRQMEDYKIIIILVFFILKSSTENTNKNLCIEEFQK